MASKANMLKSGVKRTGRGLFSGMSPMNTTAEDIQEKNDKEKASKEPSEKVVQNEAKKEESSIKPVEVSVNEDVVTTEEKAEIVKEIKTTPESVNKSSEISEPIEEAIITVQDNAEDVRVEDVHTAEATSEEIAAVHKQPVPEEKRENVTEKEVEPVSAVNVIEKQTPVSRQEPVKEKETSINYNETVPTFDRSDKAEKKQSEKQSSRYEKEKFLLLDIRGYRDYVEHMSKAFNMSATKYIRMLIENDMKLNEDIYREHKAFEEKLRERSLK